MSEVTASELFDSKTNGEIDLEKIPQASSVDDLLQRLPDVPEDEKCFTNPIDEDIEVRLLRLKFFRKTWCRDPSQRTAVASWFQRPDDARHCQ